jgi:hypothetical protein
MALVLDIARGIGIWLCILAIGACFMVALEWVLDVLHERKKK